MRFCLCFLALAAGLIYAAPAKPGNATLSGRLVVTEGKPAVVQTADNKRVVLDGDDSTRQILQDKRLNGFKVEARGRYTSPDHFLIDPIYTHGIMVRKDGHLKLISYYCDTCNIRAWTPGPCVCCQRETRLDLIDPDKAQQ
jgi:hypothetical protein